MSNARPADEETRGIKFRGKAHSLNRVRTKLIESRGEVEWLQGQGEELWKYLHPACKQGGGRTFWLGDRLNHRMLLGLV